MIGKLMIKTIIYIQELLAWKRRKSEDSDVHIYMGKGVFHRKLPLHQIFDNNVFSFVWNAKAKGKILLLLFLSFQALIIIIASFKATLFCFITESNHILFPSFTLSYFD